MAGTCLVEIFYDFGLPSYSNRVKLSKVEPRFTYLTNIKKFIS